MLTHFVLKQNHMASEHSTQCSLSEKISKESELSSQIRLKKQPTMPVDMRPNSKDLFLYSACVRMIRMAVMQELVSCTPVCEIIENYLRQPP